MMEILTGPKDPVEIPWKWKQHNSGLNKLMGIEMGMGMGIKLLAMRGYGNFILKEIPHHLIRIIFTVR